MQSPSPRPWSAFAAAGLAFGATAIAMHLSAAPYSQWFDLHVLATEAVGASVLALVGGAIAVALAAIVRRAAPRIATLDVALALVTAVLVVTQAWFFLEPMLARISPGLSGGAGIASLAAAAVALYAIVRGIFAARGVGARRMLVPWVAILCLLPVFAAALSSGVEQSSASQRVPGLAALGMLFCAAIALAARLRGGTRVAACAGVVALAIAALRFTTVNPHDRVEIAPAPPPGRGPSVLLIVLDTFRADAFDPSGVRTPNLARLAARADVHPHAIANASWTLPGHASLFTGRFLAHHRTDLTPTPGFSAALSPSIPTAAALFSDAGYATACISANAIVGLRNGMARGCQRYQNPGRAWLARTTDQRLVDMLGDGGGRSQLQLELFGVNENATADEIVDAGLREVEAARAPLFLFLNFLDVHGPIPPPPAAELPEPAARRAEFRDRALRLFGRIDDATLWERNARTLRAYYDGQVRALDRQLGRLFDELERRGWLDDAIVIVTADHGEAFYENPKLPGYFGHHSAYEAAVRIPLIVKRPGQREGTTSPGLAQQADVLPTLLALAGLPPAPGVDGRPLYDPTAHPVVTEWYTRSDPGAFPFQPARRGAIYDGAYKYLRDAAQGEFLYDLARSPYEAVDVLGEQPEAAARLRAALDAALRSDAPDAKETKPVDPRLRDQLRALGYVE